MKLVNIINALRADNLLLEYNGDLDLSISHVSYNSNNVVNNTLFVCKGLKFKEEYLSAAKKDGAVAYVSEKRYQVDLPCILVKDERKALAIIGKTFYYDSKDLLTIAVTGTKGKSTVCTFIHNMLDEHEKSKTAYMTTISYYTGKENGDAHNTTEESMEIYKRIKDIKDSNIKYLTLEVSSQAAKLDRIYGMNFNYGVLTNIGKDHIAPLEHKDFAEYLNCKIAILNKCNQLIIYKHTDYYDEIIKKVGNKKIITYGITKDCDFYVKDIKLENKINTFTVVSKNSTQTYKINMIGAFNVMNAVAAIALGDQLGIAYEDIYKGLFKTSVLGRMNIFNEDNFPIVVDYAHNGISFKALIDELKKLYPDKKLKMVFGSCGEKGVNRRIDIATIAGDVASYVYFTAEDPGKYTVAEIVSTMTPILDKCNVPYEIIEDRNIAVTKALNEATNDDVVVMLGKGDEKYQLTSKGYIPMKSDIEMVLEYLDKKKVG